MSDRGDLLLSVRGEARKVVSPDYATVAASVASSAGSKETAVRAAAEALESLTADLETRGGVALDAGTERRPLTWSAQSVTTLEERAHDDRTGRHERTGNFTAVVAIMVTLRDFELLDSLGALLAAHEKVSVHQVTWDVDWDNPAWPEVRADAIQAAIRKGRDYASALGGSLRSVEHIADAGLLDSDSAQHRPTRAVAFGRAAHGDSDAPSLDPVPQELTAIIEARLTADGVSFSSLFMQEAPPDEPQIRRR